MSATAQNGAPSWTLQQVTGLPATLGATTTTNFPFASAPVINSVTPTPPSPGSVGVPVSFLADVTYDGLSGPLVYAWGGLLQGGFPFDTVFPVDSTVNPASYTFTLSDFYFGTLVVSTTLNPALSDSAGVSYLAT